MGMLLFNKSGTFVPSDYGLSAGDMLHIVAIGGGGSSGAAGGATSFGSLLTVAGGAAAGSRSYGGEGGWHPALPVTLCSAPHNMMPRCATSFSNAGGLVCYEVLLSGSSSALSTYTVTYPNYSMYGGGGGERITHTGTSSTDKATCSATGVNGRFDGVGGDGAYAYVYTSHTLTVEAAGGGSGYGAGGGGGYAQSNMYGIAEAKNGGAHGAFNWLDFTLTTSSPTSFAITIGAGGAAGTVAVQSDNASKCYYNYGAGAPGCVAIYW